MQVIARNTTTIDEMNVILGALTALRRGDTAVRLPAEWHGTFGRVADVFNDVLPIEMTVFGVDDDPIKTQRDRHF